ncbi:hypothetical protein [Mollivirus kamchatka]|nr:hypothetical protein [Mollivirus kamchatka]
MNRQTDKKAKKPSQEVVVPNRPTNRPSVRTMNHRQILRGTDGGRDKAKKPSQEVVVVVPNRPTKRPHRWATTESRKGWTDRLTGQRRPRGQEVVVSNQPYRAADHQILDEWTDG